MKTELVTLTPNVEEAIVEIARVSSSRKDKKENPENLINYLIQNKHWSPFEHGFMTIKIETSKAIGIQLIRHRSFTFQEFSQRYAEVTKIEDIELRKQAETNRQSSTEEFNPITFNYKGLDIKASEEINKLLRNTMRLYTKLLEKGVARECARMILPMATSTTIYMTGSIRSWIHFIQIRDDSHAQKEIQLIAKEIKDIFKTSLPILSKALNYDE